MHNVLFANGHVLYRILGFKVHNMLNRQQFSAYKLAATDVFLNQTMWIKALLRLEIC